MIDLTLNWFKEAEQKANSWDHYVEIHEEELREAFMSYPENISSDMCEDDFNEWLTERDVAQLELELEKYYGKN